MVEIKKNNKGITLVSLVVTIIILIILAGVSINMTLGEGGIITIAKRAKENMQLAQVEEQKQLNELYMQLENEEGTTGGEINYDIIAKLNNFKRAIADYIEEAGGIKPEYTADTETFGERIKGIVAKVTESTNAEDAQILQNYIAYSKGKLRTGTMVNQEAKTATVNAGESYTIPEGYHNGRGKVEGASLASQTQGTATAEDIVEGKTAWVNGNKITGNNSNKDKVTLSLSTGAGSTDTYALSWIDVTQFTKITFIGFTGNAAYASWAWHSVILYNDSGGAIFNSGLVSFNSFNSTYSNASFDISNVNNLGVRYTQAGNTVNFNATLRFYLS